MKKILALTLAALMALALTACGGSSEQAAEESSEAASENMGVANPWTEAETAEAAAEGAGVGSFQLPENGTETSGGQIDWEGFQYMEGLAEADGWIGTAELTVRKGLAQDFEDPSGDYTEYRHTWEQDAGGLTVLCSGNVEGMATKVIWLSDDCSYSINVLGQGDLNDNYGLSPETVEELVSAIK